ASLGLPRPTTLNTRRLPARGRRQPVNAPAEGGGKRIDLREAVEDTPEALSPLDHVECQRCIGSKLLQLRIERFDKRQVRVTADFMVAGHTQSRFCNQLPHSRSMMTVDLRLKCFRRRHDRDAVGLIYPNIRLIGSIQHVSRILT